MTSQGDVMLPFQAGPIILNVQFLMVEDLSPFNAIVGLAWLHRMKVVHSMYHQMVSYLTEEGQINFLGSQLATRKCSQVALASGHSTKEEARSESSNTREQQKLRSLAEKDPPTTNPFQPLYLSHGTNQITYTSSLLMYDELELLGSMLQ